MDIPELAQAAALADLAKLSQERAELLKRADELLAKIQPAAVHAVESGAGRNRVRELAGVSTTLFYAWLEGAGIEVRTKAQPRRTAKGRGGPDTT